MDMSGMSMSMATASSTASGSMASSTSSSMSGMDMGSSSSCQISMLWNWYTIDSCFISSSWHVTSRGMFAGSCIGVICLVILLEFLRRVSKEYDRYILQRFRREVALAASYSRVQKVTAAAAASSSCCQKDGDDHQFSSTSSPSPSLSAMKNLSPAVCAGDGAPILRFRPTLVQQSIRALLHMLTFAVAYFVMLLAMYYNGYFIICIFIGAYLGAFVFTWESVSIAGVAGSGPQGTVGDEGVTVCCG